MPLSWQPASWPAAASPGCRQLQRGRTGNGRPMWTDGLVSSLTSPCPGSTAAPALPSCFPALVPAEVTAPDKSPGGAAAPSPGQQADTRAAAGCDKRLQCAGRGGTVSWPAGGCQVGREHPSFRRLPPRLGAFSAPGWPGGAALGIVSCGCQAFCWGLPSWGRIMLPAGL